MFSTNNAHHDSLKGTWPDHAITLGQPESLARIESFSARKGSVMTRVEFARELVDRLQEMMPDGIKVSADGAAIWF